MLFSLSRIHYTRNVTAQGQFSPPSYAFAKLSRPTLMLRLRHHIARSTSTDLGIADNSASAQGEDDSGHGASPGTMTYDSTIEVADKSPGPPCIQVDAAEDDNGQTEDGDLERESLEDCNGLSKVTSLR